MRYFLLVTFLFLGACNRPTEIERYAETAARTEADQKQAVAEFLSHSYPGWSERGITSYDCPCDIHLTRGNETKVVSIMLNEMKKEDGTQYWLAYEARPADLRVRDMEDCKDLLDDARPPDESPPY